ncbi:MAG: tetratricopeptide repeat protein [Candidatus Scalinduaceae bacterium]
MKPLRSKIALISFFIFTGYALNSFGETSTPYFDMVGVYKKLTLGTHNDITVNSQGKIIIADGDNHRLLKIVPVTRNIEVVQVKLDYKDKPFTPYGVCIDSTDNIYIANPDLRTILVIDPDGNIKKRIGRFGGSMERPVDVAMDADNNIYVLDVIGPKVHIFKPDGKTIESIQIGLELQDSSVISLDLDLEGNIYVIDKGLGKILKITTTREIFEFEKIDYGEDKLMLPSGIAIDASDRLFITDYLNNTLYQFDNTGRLIKEHLLVKEFLKQPSSITYCNNNAYIINEGNDEIFQFDLKYAESSIEHELLGEWYFYKGFYKGAIQELNTAIELGYDYTDAHYFLGLSYYNIENFQKSIEHLEKSLKGNPKDIDAGFQLGNAYHKVNYIDKAIERYRGVLSLKPVHLLAHYNLGNSYLKIGKPNNAESHYKEALQISPDYIDAKVGLGRVLLERNEDKRAEKIFSEILQENPELRQARYFLGLSFLKQEKYTEAINNLTRVSHEGPYYVDSLYYLGLSYKAIGEIIDARKCFETVLELRPGHQGANNLLTTDLHR